MNNWSNVWTVTNKFGRQPLQLRIEALMSAGNYDAPTNPTLADFHRAADFPDHSAAPDPSEPNHRPNKSELIDERPLYGI
jgi:hypothetical protein